MASIQEFRCEVCGLETGNPIHWFVIRCGDSDLTVHRSNSEIANMPGARHYCGEAHAGVYISRWFESVCAPAETKPQIASRPGDPGSWMTVAKRKSSERTRNKMHPKTGVGGFPANRR